MPLDDTHETIPEGGGASFSKAEWARAKRNVEKIRKRLAATCRHLIQSTEPPKPRKVDWEKIKAERERLAEKERDVLREAGGFTDE